MGWLAGGKTVWKTLVLVVRVSARWKKLCRGVEVIVFYMHILYEVAMIRKSTTVVVAIGFIRWTLASPL